MQTKKVVPDRDNVGDDRIAELGIGKIEVFDPATVQVVQAGSRNGGVR